MLTLTADLLRRAGRFDEALERCDRVTVVVAEADDEELDGTANVAAFIRHAAEQGDDARHDMGEVRRRRVSQKTAGAVGGAPNAGGGHPPAQSRCPTFLVGS